MERRVIDWSEKEEKCWGMNYGSLKREAVSRLVVEIIEILEVIFFDD